MGTTIWAALLGIDPAISGWVLLGSPFGRIGACTLWLTFFPNEARSDSRASVFERMAAD